MTEGQVAYREYLKSDRWRVLRMQAFSLYGRRCHRCPATCRLDERRIANHIFRALAQSRWTRDKKKASRCKKHKRFLKTRHKYAAAMRVKW